MIVVEFVEAVEVMLDAAIKWIMLFAAIGTGLGLLAGWVVTRVVKWAWRGLRRACGASDTPKAAQGVPEAPKSSEARTADPGYEEAA
ncbi:hypothetical protein [Streptomyces liliifuscus]|uniref:Uncharacterized protein n=1 Tax=Streptomyces liliifuscus TaxID=2797636 RepID=A0A7T7RFX9_9ACTN|nr:hypothetical protein [Streptomyces liliifuscus]QQM45136.1 hypothetical protein JEQ17_40895 [Streptomyces liliifuscus]